jgi:hypothetical protein
MNNWKKSIDFLKKFFVLPSDVFFRKIIYFSEN